MVEAMTNVPLYVIFSLIAAFGWALSSLANKFASKHRIHNNWVLLFYYYLTYIPFLLFIPLIFNVSIPQSGWVFIFLYALMFFIGNIFFTIAIYKLDASTFAPFFQLQAGFIALLAFLFLKERFPAENYLFLVIMLVGSIFVSIDGNFSIKTYFKLATLLIISQQVFHAFSNLFAGFALKGMNSFTFIFWGDLIAALMALFIIPFIGLNKLKVSFSQVKPLFVGSFFSTIAATSLFTAFQFNVTISSTLALLTAPIILVFTFLLSVFKPTLLEHHTRKVYFFRLIGVLLILFGAIKLSLG